MKKFMLFLLLSMCACEVEVQNSTLSVTQECIEGQVYYYTNSAYKGGIAPKLDDLGNPISCDKNNWEESASR